MKVGEEFIVLKKVNSCLIQPKLCMYECVCVCGGAEYNINLSD